MNDELTTQHDVQDGTDDEESDEAQTDESYAKISPEKVEELRQKAERFDVLEREQPAPGAEIQVGDVVIDLTQNAKMQVVAVAADSVRAFTEQKDFDIAEYKVHPQLRVRADEPVYKCAYLKGELASPGGTYDFPESRLARIPIEEANENVMRPQDSIRVELTRELLDAYDDVDEPELHNLEIAIENTLPHHLVSLVYELQQAETFGASE